VIFGNLNRDSLRGRWRDEVDPGRPHSFPLGFSVRGYSSLGARTGNIENGEDLFVSKCAFGCFRGAMRRGRISSSCIEGRVR
jgi:hypothetical protein